jgi:two-component system NarL family response regulator
MSHSQDTPVRIVIADDHPLLLEGISASLQAQPGIDVVATAMDGAEAIQVYRLVKPDVLLLDLQMPVKDGLEATVAIRSMFRDARVLILTTYSGDARVVSVLRAGAAGYVLKNISGAELARAIRTVAAGGRVIDAAVQREVDGFFPADKLSLREIDVLRLAADGNSNRVIGEQLGIGESTVKTHVSAILVKLGARDRTHAVTLALKRGYLAL